MAVDNRPLARAVMQDITSPAYRRLIDQGWIELSRGAAVAALTQAEAISIHSSREISQAIIDRLIALKAATGGTYITRTRASGSRKGRGGKSYPIPATHTYPISIIGKYEKPIFDGLVNAIKGAGGRYNSDTATWYIEPGNLNLISDEHQAELYTMPAGSNIWRPLRLGVPHTVPVSTSAHTAPSAPIQPPPPLPAPTVPVAPYRPQVPEKTQTTQTNEETPRTMPDSNHFENLLSQITPTTNTEGHIVFSPEREQALCSLLSIVLSPRMDASQHPRHASILANPDCTPERAGEIISMLSKGDVLPGTEPNLAQYTARAESYATPSDPTGLLGARQAYYSARQEYDASADSWYLRSAQRTRLVDTISAGIQLVQRDEARRIKHAEEARAQEASEKAKVALFGDTQSKLDAIREHVKTLEVLTSGIRPLIDSKYNLSSDFSRLFHALAWQLVVFGRSEHVLFTGPKGTGKTKAASVLASMLGVDLFVLNCQSIRDVRETFAERNADEGKTYWSATDFTSAVQRGYCVILLDEVTRAPGSVQNAFLSLLDNQSRIHIPGFGDVIPGPNIIWLASANEGAAYSGTARLDLALDDRFGARWEMQHLEPANAALALLHHLGVAGLVPATGSHMSTEFSPPELIDLSGFAPHGVTASVAQALARIVNAIQTAYRDASAAARLSHDEGQRTLEAMGRCWLATGPESLHYSLLSRYKDDERKAVNEIVAKELKSV